jgi:hypothetical protein
MECEFLNEPEKRGNGEAGNKRKVYGMWYFASKNKSESPPAEREASGRPLEGV